MAKSIWSTTNTRVKSRRNKRGDRYTQQDSRPNRGRVEMIVIAIIALILFTIGIGFVSYQLFGTWAKDQEEFREKIKREE